MRAWYPFVLVVGAVAVRRENSGEEVCLHDETCESEGVAPPKLDSTSRVEVKLEGGWTRYSEADQERIRDAWNNTQQDMFVVQLGSGTIWIDWVKMHQIHNPSNRGSYWPIRTVYVDSKLDSDSGFEVLDPLQRKWQPYSEADQEKLRVAWNNRKERIFPVDVVAMGKLQTVYIDSVDMREIGDLRRPKWFRYIRIVKKQKIDWDAFKVGKCPDVRPNIISWTAHGGFGYGFFTLPPNVYVLAPHKEGLERPYVTYLYPNKYNYQLEIHTAALWNIRNKEDDFKPSGWKLYGPGDQVPNAIYTPWNHNDGPTGNTNACEDLLHEDLRPRAKELYEKWIWEEPRDHKNKSGGVNGGTYNKISMQNCFFKEWCWCLQLIPSYDGTPVSVGADGNRALKIKVCGSTSLKEIAMNVSDQMQSQIDAFRSTPGYSPYWTTKPVADLLMPNSDPERPVILMPLSCNYKPQAGLAIDIIPKAGVKYPGNDELHLWAVEDPLSESLTHVVNRELVRRRTANAGDKETQDHDSKQPKRDKKLNKQEKSIKKVERTPTEEEAAFELLSQFLASYAKSEDSLSTSRADAALAVIDHPVLS